MEEKLIPFYKMSSDNLLVIVGEGPFKAYDVGIEGDDFTGLTPDFTAKNLREAVLKAEEYTRNNVVEYGYSFVDL